MDLRIEYVNLSKPLFGLESCLCHCDTIKNALSTFYLNFVGCKIIRYYEEVVL